MRNPNQIVTRVLRQARLVRVRQREDLAEELASHLEDLADAARARGVEREEAIAGFVTEHFGDPELVGRALSRVYRRDRWFMMAGAFAGLALASIIVTWALVFVVQAWAAASLGFVPAGTMTAAHLDREGLMLGALTLGYLGIFLCSHFTAGRQRLTPVGLTALAALPVIGALALWQPDAAKLLAGALGAAAVVWAIEHWNPPAAARFAGLLAFFWSLGGLAHRGMAGGGTTWLTILPTCAAIALACQCTMSLASFFDRRLLPQRAV